MAPKAESKARARAKPKVKPPASDSLQRATDDRTRDVMLFVPLTVSPQNLGWPVRVSTATTFFFLPTKNNS